MKLPTTDEPRKPEHGKESAISFNIEIKAGVEDFEPLESVLIELGARKAGILIQEDRYFKVPQGRIKIRKHADGHAEVIHYFRPDTDGPRGSEYKRFTTKEPDVLNDVLATVLGSLGTVRKERTLYLLENTRIHLDRVEGLGRFMELEVVLNSDSEAEQGIKTARSIMAALGIDPDRLIPGSYIDLLLAKGDDQRQHRSGEIKDGRDS